MLFSSMTFLFVFMPVVMAVYFLAKKEIRNYILLIASIIFYAWGEPRYLAIMIITILVNYVGAILLDKYHNPRTRWGIVTATILIDLSFLFYFKYFNFVIDNINLALSTHIDFVDVIMPIGISFYTFQAMSYLIDVYRKEVPAQRDVYKLALYIVLFPQLVAGPIVKYHDVCEQIDERKVEFKYVIIGLKRFIVGLAKKVLIANTLLEKDIRNVTDPVQKVFAVLSKGYREEKYSRIEKVDKSICLEKCSFSDEIESFLCRARSPCYNGERPLRKNICGNDRRKAEEPWKN